MRKIWGKNPKRNIIFVLCVSGIILSVQGIFVYIYIKNGTPINLAFTLSAGFLDIFAIPGSFMGIIDLLKLFRSNDDNKITVNIENQYNGVLPKQIEEEMLSTAREKLASLPLDNIPSPSILPRGSHVPDFRSNAKFLGREEELKQIAVWLKGERPEEVGQLIAVTGMGGIGKTQLVVEVIQRYGQFFEGGVFWIDFSQPKLISDQVAAFSKAWEGMKQEDKVKDTLSDWQGEIPRLLIFDNCESFDLLKRWIPPTGASRVLISSRNKGLGKELGVRQVPLMPLSQQQGIDLLHRYCPELEINDPDLAKIVEEVGGLPLALHMAGMFLQKYHHEVSTADYLQELRKAKPLKHRSLVEKIFSPTGHEPSIERTISVSYKKLGKGKEDQMTVRLLQRAACFAPGVWIPRQVLKNSLGDTCSAESFADGLHKLLAIGLVDENEIGDIWVHRLVCNFTLERENDEFAILEVEKAVVKYANFFNDYGNPNYFQPLLVHLLFLYNNFPKEHDKLVGSIENALGIYFMSLGNYPIALEYFGKALDVRSKLFGEDNLDTATSMGNLGNLLISLEEFDKAKSLIEKSLFIRKKYLGPEHELVANSLNNLGGLYMAEGLYNEAHLKFEQALKVRQKIYGILHLDTATCLDNLGNVFVLTGEFDKAKNCFQKSLFIRGKVLIKNHPDFALSLNNYGGLLYSVGNYSDALYYFQKSQAIIEKVLGNEHPDYANSLNNLGGLLISLGRFDEAKPYLEKALIIRRKIFGQNHSETASSLNQLGWFYLVSDEPEKALPFLQEALIVCKKRLGENHPETATCLNNLGGYYASQEKFEEALDCFSEALKIRKKIFGESHNAVANSYNSFGYYLSLLGDYDRAEVYYKKALHIMEELLGINHPDYQQVVADLKIVQSKKHDSQN